MRRELVRLVLAVALLHGLFIVAYYLFQLERGSRPLKAGYTAVWTVVTLLVALRGLLRIRSLRAGGPRRIPRG